MSATTTQGTTTPPPRLPRRRRSIPDFTTEPTSIPEVVIHRFDENNPWSPSPLFVVDYCGYANRLENWLRSLQQNPKPHYTVCTINGFVKAGKTTALTFVLPALIRRHFPQAKVCFIDMSQINFESLRDLLQQVQDTIYRWAKAEGLQVTPAEREFVGSSIWFNEVTSLLDTIAEQATVFFLWDEVQQWFKLPVPELPAVYTYFKPIVSSSTRHNQYHAITGSGMVTAWSAFCKVPSNGHSLAVSSWRVSLLPTDKPEIVQLCRSELQKAYPGVPSLVFNYASLTPAGTSFAVTEYQKKIVTTEVTLEFDEDEFTSIHRRYTDEFCQDMLPLMEEMTPETRLALLHLAWGTYPYDPSSLFVQLYEYYFQPFLVSYDFQRAPGLAHWLQRYRSSPDTPQRTYGLIWSEFSLLINNSIDPESGALRINSLRAHATVPLHRHRLLLGLARAGELVNQADQDLYSRLNDGSASVFRRHGTEIFFTNYRDFDWFSFFLDHTANEGAKRRLINHRFNYGYTEWYCDLLILIRNAVYHLPNDNGESLREAAQHLPVWSVEWLQALKSHLPREINMYV